MSELVNQARSRGELVVRPSLAATLHDPDGRIVSAVREKGDTLWPLYHSVHIVATPNTASELISILRESGADVNMGADSRIGVGRLRAVQNAVQSGAPVVHYCDFDRIFHWLQVARAELEAVLTQLVTACNFDYLILGRTARAFDTHPRVQRETETVTNHAFSAWFGSPADVGAGSCGITLRGVNLIAEHSEEPTNATDAEWPAIVHCLMPCRVCYRATLGLSFETSDYYRTEIEETGGEMKWREQVYEHPEMWLRRLELSHNSIRSMLRVAQRLHTQTDPSSSDDKSD